MSNSFSRCCCQKSIIIVICNLIVPFSRCSSSDIIDSRRAPFIVQILSISASYCGWRVSKSSYSLQIIGIILCGCVEGIVKDQCWRAMCGSICIMFSQLSLPQSIEIQSYLLMHSFSKGKSIDDQDEKQAKGCFAIEHLKILQNYITYLNINFYNLLYSQPQDTQINDLSLNLNSNQRIQNLNYMIKYYQSTVMQQNILY